MNRSFRISFFGAVLLLCIMPVRAQQALDQMNGTGAIYPDSSEGLHRFLQETLETVKSKNATEESAFVHTLIMPDDSGWFQDKFGPAYGPRLATAYQKKRAELEEEIKTVYEGDAERGWLQPKIFRYADAAMADPPIDNFLNCMDVVVPLYQTAFHGNSTSYYYAPGSSGLGSKIVAGDLPGYYIYTEGSFRFIPQSVLLLLPKRRPVRIQLDMDVIHSKMITNYNEISFKTMKNVMNLHSKGKVVIHFVVDTKGNIKEASVVEGPSDLSDIFLQEVKQWAFEPTKLDGDPVEVEVNFETGVQFNGKY